eukprot:CAMPEP_0197658424 /NCGR_PEP_ID=MMETSP1338-20131121/45234_1 /TAXON_ID=43686 ORGANISM="Pelagodinium beii, Strain RCC1491" /NCGR_SAMPLE_ID=MMETSP1338 /ASSEMBLY_ACC=CAM_ASM_000754 /LENGTH=72 /DNA_ID=CAMNT_0043235015 /DNA_START=49 /DNA_END=267 /DNA_ORIENTATION=-
MSSVMGTGCIVSVGGRKGVILADNPNHNLATFKVKFLDEEEHAGRWFLKSQVVRYAESSTGRGNANSGGGAD